MTNFIPGEGPLVRPPTIDEFYFRLTVSQDFIETSGSSSTATVNDSNIRTVTSDYSDPYYDIDVVGVADKVVLSLLDATGSLLGNRVSRVSDGNCRVIARNPWMSRTETLDMSRIDDNVHYEHVGYVSGSMAQHVIDQTTTLIGDSTSANMPIFSLQDHAGSNYVRNPNCWASDLNLTAISPWNSLGVQYRAGVAITPAHVLHAAHYPVQVGTVLRFVTNGNVVVERTVSAIYDLPETAPYQRDTQIVRLGVDLPNTITPVKFLPANAYEFLPSWYDWKIPLVATNQFERMVAALSTAGDVSPVDYIGAWVTTESPYAAVYERVISGDSGSPAFLVINGELVLICHWTGAGQGAAHHQMLTEIAAAITSLGGGHSLQTADLDEFPSYA